jgi:TrmH family RNA methyltransferase
LDHILISQRGAENKGVRQIEMLCYQKHIRTEVADCAVDRIAGCENAYIVGIFEKYNAPLQNADHIVLVNPSDCGNLGTILRAAVAYNVKNIVIIRPAVDIFDPKVIRASMGAVFRVNFAYFSAFDEYQSCFGNHLYPFMTNGKIPLPCATFVEPFSLVFGSEGAGLSKIYREIGESIYIPQSSAVDSLNLSVAVGIALYASSLQRLP